jgi:hypothetical protein
MSRAPAVVTPVIGTFPEWLESKAAASKPKGRTVRFLVDSVDVAPKKPAPPIEKGATRFSIWSDGTLQIIAPRCKGWVTEEEADALLAFLLARRKAEPA